MLGKLDSLRDLRKQVTQTARELGSQALSEARDAIKEVMLSSSVSFWRVQCICILTPLCHVSSQGKALAAAAAKARQQEQSMVSIPVTHAYYKGRVTLTPLPARSMGPGHQWMSMALFLMLNRKEASIQTSSTM